MMAGDINEQIKNTDVFNDFVSLTKKSKYPVIQNKCSANDKSCTVNTVTISHNNYAGDTFDSGKSPQGATEMKVKMPSRQALNIAAGNTDASFDLDEKDAKNICSEINQKALNWAMKKATPQALKNYE